MATGQTPVYLLPYPLSTDPVDVHGDIFELSDRLEDVIGGLSSLPTQSGNNGKFLTTDGSSASWATIPTTSAATPTMLGTVYGLTQSSSVDPANIALGQEIYDTLTTGTWNLALGHGAMTGITSGDDNVAVGAYTLYDNTSGSYNTVVGQYSAWGGDSLSPGSNNTVVGANSGGHAIKGQYNIVLGVESGNYIAGDRNIAIGAEAMDRVNGDGNIGIGWYTYWYGGTTDSSIAIGSASLMYEDAGYNIAIGDQAMQNKTTGTKNVAIGIGANSLPGYGAKASLGYNTFIGSYSGTQSQGQQNVIIGYSASGYDPVLGAPPAASVILTTGSNDIIIGSQASPSSATVSNEITLGNSNINRFRVPGMEIDWSYVISDEATTIPSAPTATTNYELKTDRNVRYHTVNAVNNWVLNLRGDDATTYDSISLINKAVTIVFMNTNGATAYYPTAFQIDGTARTVKWQGGTAPTAGNASSIDVYTYTVIKTAVNTYTVLGSQTKFA